MSELPVQKLLVSEAESGQKLVSYLKRRLGQKLPPSLLQRIIRSGEVRVNGKRGKPFLRLSGGDEIRIPPLRLEDRAAAAAPAQPPALPELEIIADLPGYLVVNKPAGLPAHPGTRHNDSLSTRLEKIYAGSDFKPTAAHRLDKNTSGLVLVGKTYRALRQIQDGLREHSIHKDYLAWVLGAWPYDSVTALHDVMEKQEDEHGRGRVLLGEGKEALCLVRAVLRAPRCTLLCIRLQTGRTHQIRVQLSSRGHPIVGDAKYGSPAGRKFGITGMCLHAWRLGMPDGHSFAVLPPWSGAFAVAEADLGGVVFAP